MEISKVKEIIKKKIKYARRNQDSDYGYYKGIETGLLDALKLIGMVDNKHNK